MSDTYQALWTMCPTIVAAVLKTASADGVVTAADLDTPAAGSPPPAAVTPPAPAPKPVTPAPTTGQLAESTDNVIAPFHSTLTEIATGKKSLITPLNWGNLQPEQLAVDKLLRTDVDKLTPQELAQQTRTYLALQNSGFDKAMGNKRLFANPFATDPADQKSRLTFGNLSSLYSKRYEQLSPEEAKAYSDSLGDEAEKMGLALKAPGLIKEKVGTKLDELHKAIAEVDKNPDATGFTDWFTSSWANMAVPAGFLMMIFGGNTGAIIGGLAMAAGGYNLYNRYSTLMKDPVAQDAIHEYVASNFSKEALKKVEEQYGPQYAQAANDFGFLSRYGFLSSVQSAYQNAGAGAYKWLVPGADEKNVNAFRAQLAPKPNGPNTWINDWSGKAWDTVSAPFRQTGQQ